MWHQSAQFFFFTIICMLNSCKNIFDIITEIVQIGGLINVIWETQFHLLEAIKLRSKQVKANSYILSSFDPNFLPEKTSS